VPSFPPGSSIAVSSGNGSSATGPLVLVALDPANFPAGSTDTYGIAQVNVGSTPQTTAQSWTAGPGLTTSVTPISGTTTTAGQTYVGTTTNSAVQTSLSAAGVATPLTVYVYNRFEIGCAGGGGAFASSGVDFTASGLTPDSTANADLSIQGPCTNATLTVPQGFTYVPYDPNPFTYYNSTSFWQLSYTSRPLILLARSVNSQSNVLPIIMKTQSGLYVKLLLTQISVPNNTISGAYEVDGAAPGDGF